MNLPLDYLDDFPLPMKRYLKYFGWHFNKKAYEFASSLMWKEDDNKKRVKVEPLKKEDVDDILNKGNVKIDTNGTWDYMYWAMQCKADLMPHAIEDNKHMAQYIKCMTDDADAPKDSAFRVWYIKAIGSGIGIPFDEFLD